MFTGVTIEPFFMLNYYSNIVTAWFNMPEERFMEMPIDPSAVDGELFMSWSTPSATGAILGMAIYSLVCLILAYFFYKRRQN